MTNNRIKYALHLNNWSYEKGSRHDLLVNGQKITPIEFDESMSGNIFCPVCFTNLTRSPKNKSRFSNSRNACFMHLKSYCHIECNLRTPKSEGVKYETEELAAQAISNGELVVINSFMESHPLIPNDSAAPYKQSAIEDEHGPISLLPIARHKGKSFNLPSKITTIRAICTNFDDNLYRYYILPNQTHAQLLISSINNIEDITDVVETPKLYWGIIEKSFNAGKSKKRTNMRMTKLKSNPNIVDFYLKDNEANQADKGISDESVGRIVIFWGKIGVNGVGLCVERLKWGEYSLLAKKYENLLI
ncbi:hypothetical protein [Corticimicrobacter populi]|uniref:Uncharacterized protein n=1 Tax=Corticimicrobacter populi TaxID=2175229 RepID=A0A2V1JYS0_9BURK|nr:hypothetical protein [Corticimicrobacter populi]PWF22926.1 hypothetical protein DD235_07880 [Corticimicrobacter populi]